MRATTLLNKLLSLPGIWVRGIQFEDGKMIVQINARFRCLTCPHCQGQVKGRFHRTMRRWRHLAIGGIQVFVEGEIRRLRCRTCKRVVTEEVPWARHRSPFTRPLEDLVAFLAQRLPKSTIVEALQISWTAIGPIAERVVQERLSGERFDSLRRIGVDEISFRKRHRYLTIVVDHDARRVIWAAEGKSADTLGAFFDQLSPKQLARIEVVSMDMSAAYQKAVREALPCADIVFDKFHVAQLAQRALDEVRRQIVRELPRPERTTVKSSRWPLLKSPGSLNDEQERRLAEIQRSNQPLYRAYLLKESLLELLYAPGPEQARREAEAWLSWASRSRLEPFVKLARTVRRHLKGILRIISTGLTNARLEGMNNKIRLLSHRAFGFHSAESLIAMIYLCCTGIRIEASHLA